MNGSTSHGTGLIISGGGRNENFRGIEQCVNRSDIQQNGDTRHIKSLPIVAHWSEVKRHANAPRFG